MAKILRVDMSELSVTVQHLPSDAHPTGGRRFTSGLVAREVPPLCHPLGPANKLVFAPGWLGGTGAPCSGRLSVGAKSPLTGTIKESNAGGNGANALARLGIAGIVVEGAPPDGRLRLLRLGPESARLEEADDLRGLGNYDTVARLQERSSGAISCVSIGPAGEMKLAAAGIAVTDEEMRPTRYAGRGGMGAVMGSKGLKAIVVDNEHGERPASANLPAFREASARFARSLRAHAVTGQALPTYGTNVLANILNEAGAYPTRNFSAGQFEGVSAISGETQRDTIIARGGVPTHACHKGCTIRCSRIYHDANGEYLTKGPEYETIWAHGADCGIDDLDAIARMDRLDDDLGLDTIEMGATIGVAMAAGVIPFGDAEGAIRLLEEVRAGSPLGRIIGSGAEAAGKVFGVVNVPVVKGQAIPAYDPRAVKGIGVTYATSTMGADHTAGYAVAQNILSVGGEVDPLKPDGQAALSRTLQIATALIDSTGLCLFVAFAVLDDPEAFPAIVDMTNAHLGLALDAEALTALGAEVLRAEREFNTRAGFGPQHDRLPAFFAEEPLPPHNVVFDVPAEELDAVHGS
ncbi:MAG: aldehyde ferredoxin oxidoreductase [Armatimonadetes bacterium]|nr:aldehyde ferredoxin oxidoreductase [Armatimonadota bacterium]